MHESKAFLLGNLLIKASVLKEITWNFVVSFAVKRT